MLYYIYEKTTNNYIYEKPILYIGKMENVKF